MKVLKGSRISVRGFFATKGVIETSRNESMFPLFFHFSLILVPSAAF